MSRSGVADRSTGTLLRREPTDRDLVGVALLVAATALAAWRVGRVSVMDVGRGLGFAVVALVALGVGQGDLTRRVALAVATVVWAAGWPGTSPAATAGARIRATSGCSSVLAVTGSASPCCTEGPVPG